LRFGNDFFFEAESGGTTANLKRFRGTRRNVPCRPDFSKSRWSPPWCWAASSGSSPS